jgi:hypothetical protein
VIAAYLLIALQIADVISTLVALRNPKLREANKFLLRLFELFGQAPTLIGTKAIFIAFFWWAHPYVYEPVIWALCVFYAYIVVNNVRLIREHQ